MFKGARKETIDTFTENVGAGGICVVLDAKFDLFEKVSLEIFLGDDGGPVSCEGSIVWVVKQHAANKWEALKYDTGIEFQNIKDEDKQRLYILIKNILITST